jgi:hypothetical protein
MTQLTEIQQFKITTEQKKTLQTLHKKYKINTSQFIRDAINEKLQRDKGRIFKTISLLLQNCKKANIGFI